MQTDVFCEGWEAPHQCAAGGGGGVWGVLEGGLGKDGLEVNHVEEGW